MVAEKDRIVWVNNRGYDGEKFSSKHPGGELFLRLFGGRDASDAFATYHRRKFPHKRMADYLVEQKDEEKREIYPTSATTEDDEDYLELCKEVNAKLREIGHAGGYATTTYWLKCWTIIVGVFLFEYLLVTSPSYFVAFTLGLLYAFVGLDIHHDAHHGAISKKPWVNYAYGLITDWSGSSGLLWLQQHVAIHHVECNGLDYDRDMLENPAIRLSSYHWDWPWMRLQHFYLLFAEPGYSFKQYFLDWYNMIMNMYEGVPISTLVKPWRRYLNMVTRIFFFVRLFVLPAYLHGTVEFLPYFLTFLITVGGYLAFFFLISHNHMDVYHVVNNKIVYARDPLDESKHRKNSLLARQTMTSCNVGGPLLAFFNGGLNYQIEHHLFPRVCHVHYATIAPIVKSFCEKKGIQYIHFPTVWDNFVSTFKYFRWLGSAKRLERTWLKKEE
eukprot:m.65104 g.65104  ORF g.65104 m.65104 type:complete len:442 (+) comp11514_c0_seq1:168-1493(+)